MSTEENKAIVRRFLEELVSTGDPALADELLASNYVLHFGGNPPMDGQGFRQFLGMFRSAFPDLRVTVEDEIAEGDKVATRFTWRGTHRGPFQGIAPTGKHVTGSGIAIYRVTNGKIAEDIVQEDTLGLLQQLGAIPAPGGS
jgi:steroid delta-isomerase-like uncharacterized protein